MDPVFHVIPTCLIFDSIVVLCRRLIATIFKLSFIWPHQLVGFLFTYVIPSLWVTRWLILTSLCQHIILRLMYGKIFVVFTVLHLKDNWHKNLIYSQYNRQYSCTTCITNFRTEYFIMINKNNYWMNDDAGYFLDKRVTTEDLIDQELGKRWLLRDPLASSSGITGIQFKNWCTYWYKYVV